MTATQLDRMASAAGLAAAGTMLIGGVAGNINGGPPSPAAGPAPAAYHYSVAGDAAQISAYANALAAVLVVVFAAGLWRRLPSHRGAQAWPLTGVVGAGMLGVMLLVVSAVQLALPRIVDAGGAAALFPVFVLWGSAVPLVGVAAVPLLVGFGLSGRPAGGGWLMWVALAGAGAALVGALPVDAITDAAGARHAVELIGAVQYPALFAWLVGASLLLRRPGSDRSLHPRATVPS